MKAHYLIVMGFRHLEPIVKISRRRPTLLPAHSQVLVAVSSIELPHDRSRSERIGSGLHSLSRHFYESSLLNCNGLSSFITNCKVSIGGDLLCCPPTRRGSWQSHRSRCRTTGPSLRSDFIR